MMKRFATYIFLLLCSVTLWAKPYSAQTLPELDRYTRVSNPDGILSQNAVDSIHSMLRALDAHNVFCIVAVVKNIEGDDPYKFAIELGRRYELGGKQSQGVVIALATDDRSYFISTGTGMEKYLPDAICKRIENQAMLPYLKQSDWDNAVMACVRDMKGYLEKNPEIMEQYRDDYDSGEDDAFFTLVGILFLFGIGFIILSVIYTEYKESKCPYCGKHSLKKESTRIKKLSSLKYEYHITYKCKNCGKTTVKTRIHEQQPPTIIIGGGGGRSGGFSGGFGGGGGFGGFGGGSFGGGGAGGRF